MKPLWSGHQAIVNLVLTLPTPEGFESAIQKDYVVNTIGLDSIDRVDFKTNSTRGQDLCEHRLRQRQPGHYPVFSPLTALYQQTASCSLIMRSTIIQETSCVLISIIRITGRIIIPTIRYGSGGDDKPWVFAYDLVAKPTGLGGWKHALINVNDVLDTVVP